MRMRETGKFIFAGVLLLLLAGMLFLIDRVKPNTVEPVDTDVSTTNPQITDTSEADDSLQLYAQQISQVQTPTTLTLTLMSDTHYCQQESTAAEKLNTARKMGELSNYIQVDAIANLGDFVRGDEPTGETVTDLMKLMDATEENAQCPVFYVRGNHDDNGWYSLEKDGKPGDYLQGEMIDDAQWAQWAFRAAQGVVIDSENPNGGYGYYDHEASKIRIFILNSVEIPYILEEDGTYRYNSYQCYAFSNRQLQFVADALQFSDKDDPSQWAALFLTHVPVDTTNDNGNRFGVMDAQIRGNLQFLGIVDAYRKGIAYEFQGSVNNVSNEGERPEDFMIEISVDYSQKGPGEVIGFVSGHTHTDNLSQKVGYENSLSYGYSYLSLIGSDSFATMVVDRENGLITTFKYGEVRPQNNMEEFNPGAIDGEAEQGISMQSGVWSLTYDQFLPTGENLYQGLSDLWGDGYTSDGTTVLDPKSLELVSAQENEKWAISKAIPVKQATQYVISDIGSSLIQYYRPDGKFSSVLKPVERDGQWIISTKTHEKGGYLVICFHKASAGDLDRVELREWVGNTR